MSLYDFFTALFLMVVAGPLQSFFLISGDQGPVYGGVGSVMDGCLVSFFKSVQVFSSWFGLSTYLSISQPLSNVGRRRAQR